MAITLTDKAAQRVQKLLAKQGGIGLRLGLRKAGCAGQAYTFDIAQDIGEGDSVFESNGAKVVVDRASLLFLDGSQLDYAKEGMNEVFKFNNPNEKSACGCGESVNF
ncbi:MAG TPA: iron-sulfur cluster assembly accessory protein [Gammaproteobacteria bacterium]|nr:iron-sulfur cluster assembly accessory protein [Gammaproteobacteria bacterium]